METVLLYALGVLVFLFGVAVSIALHELGHFVPAKLFGVKVGQFMIGFGPTLFSRFRGETEYGVKAFPLGGYISMAGMYPPEKPGRAARTASTSFLDTLARDARDQQEEWLSAEENRLFYRLPAIKRIIVMLGGPVMNLVIAIVLYAIVLCGFGIPQYVTALSVVNECMSTSFEQSECAPGDPVSPAAAAGLRPGDRIISIDGVRVESWLQATEMIRDRAEQNVPFVVERGGTELVLSVTPVRTSRPVLDSSGEQVRAPDGEVLTADVGFIGVAPATKKTQQPLTAVLPTVGDNVARVAGIIVTLPQRLVQVAEAAFGSAERDPNGPVGVVGVGRIAGEITALDTVPVLERVTMLLSVLASLNVALFVFNLIPLLPLDGGHVAGALWEALRRRIAKLAGRADPGPVDIARLIPVTLVIVAIFGGMTLLLAYADIVNPITLQ